MARYRGRRGLHVPSWKRLLLLFLTAVFLLSGGLLGRDLYRAHGERRAYRELAERIREPRGKDPDLFAAEGEAAPAQPAAAPGEEISLDPSPYEALSLENPDFSGWLSIEGTPIDYPVMYTPQEPEYYLRRAFDRSDAVSGSLFIGADCGPDTPHVMIYGHNMKDGSMFGSLLQYAQADHAAAHPVIRFDTLDRNGEYRVLSAFYSHAHVPGEEGFRYYQYADLSRREDFEEYVQKAKGSALYDTGAQAEYGDRLLTLSTCSYHRENGTFVVVAVSQQKDNQKPLESDDSSGFCEGQTL